MVAMTHEKNVEKNREFRPTKLLETTKLVGGFNLSEKHESNWIISRNRGENKKYVKPPLSKASNYNHFSPTSNQESLKAGCRNSYLTLI